MPNIAALIADSSGGWMVSIREKITDKAQDTVKTDRMETIHIREIDGAITQYGGWDIEEVRRKILENENGLTLEDVRLNSERLQEANRQANDSFDIWLDEFIQASKAHQEGISQKSERER